jgi:hypothetical protein
MKPLKIIAGLLILLTAGLFAHPSAQAGGPLYVTGLDADNPGEPYRWLINPIPYLTDKGELGNQINSEANDLVSAAFNAWQDVETASITIQNTGSLDYDVTGSNIIPFWNAIGDCEDAGQPVNSILYDQDGSILDKLGMDYYSTLGFAASICTDDVAGAYTRGLALLNGRSISGTSGPLSRGALTLEEFSAVFIHELGHLLGLDHAQINLNCYTDISCPDEDLAGVPIMFPVLLDNVQPNLKRDDIAAISRLYPDVSFFTTTGRIQGHVFFSDGRTPAQGYNVIARKVGDPRSTAVSCVSGFLFTAGAGNDLVPEGEDTNSYYGSRDQALIGYYDIPGLPSGEYTIEVEAINNSGTIPFVEGSGVGPIGNGLGFQFKMPGICELQYLNYPPSPDDSCSDFTTVTVGAGSTINEQTDIILLGTPPRYDAWEDGP